MVDHGYRFAARSGAFLLVVFATGCSAFSTSRPLPMPAPLEPVHVTQPAPAPRVHCALAQRDLTLPWGQHRYWCLPEDAPIAQGRAPVRPERTVATGACAPALRSVGVRRDRVEPQPARRAAVDSGVEAAPNWDAATISKSAGPSVATADSGIHRHHIAFARNLQVLGPRGRRTLEALLPAARAHCARVAGSPCIGLRGASLGAGVEAHRGVADVEELAVGRALAVRQALERAGIGRGRIRILAPDPEEAARRVEVELRG